MSATERPKQQFKLSMYVLLLFAVISTLGFYLLGYMGGQERSILQCLYLTANIFSTVGNWTESFTAGEKVWEIMMILFGIGAAAYALGSVTALSTSGEVQRTFGRRSLVDKIKSLEGDYIVCGFGRMGQSICRELAREGIDFVVIEKESEATTRAEELDYIYLLGDASDEQMLRMSGIAKAKGLVATLPHDADNGFVALTARGMNERLQIIARAEREEAESRLQRAGADRVICPSVIGAMKITRMLLHPAVEEFLEATASRDLAVDRLHVRDLKGVAGQTLRDVALPSRFGITVFAVEGADGQRLFNPSAEHVLKDDEQLIVFGQRQAVDQLADESSG